MRRYLFWLAFDLPCVPGWAGAADNNDIVPLASSGSLALSDASLGKAQVARYETVEITFRMTGQWQNPFDPEEIRVDAVFTAPDGSQVTVPGFFFYQEYRRTVANGRESYQRVGEPGSESAVHAGAGGKVCLRIEGEEWRTRGRGGGSRFRLHLRKHRPRISANLPA